MEKDNWTLIDKKTQIFSLIILIVGIIVVGSVFISYMVELNIIFGISSSSILSLVIFLVIVSAIIDIILLMYFTGSRIELKKQKEEKFRKTKKTMNIKIVALVFILIISILGLNYMYNLKPYEGISIKDINDNLNEYINQSVSIQAFYYPYRYNYSLIYQNSYFHGEYESGQSYLSIEMGEYIDKSMLMDEREYIWNGIILREPWKSEYTYDNVTYTDYGNHTYLNVTKIETLYNDIERHNISKFVGSWKLIEYNDKPSVSNSTWVFYENNTLQAVNKSRVDIPLDSYEHFAVDNKDNILYYEQKEYLFHEYFRIKTFCNYDFSENNTKLTLEITKGDMIFSPEEHSMVFQKIDI